MSNREENVVYTAMPDDWDDDTCIREAKHFFINSCDAPFHEKVSEIVASKEDSRVVKITITVEDRSLSELRAGKEHRD